MQNSAALKQAPSVAHDLARYDRRSRVKEVVRATQAPQKAAVKAAPKSRMRVSPVAVALFLAAMLLLFLIVYSYMQISVFNVEASALQAELKVLDNEEKELQKKLDSHIDFATIEAQAVQELGLVKLDSSQIIGIDLSGEDHGEVLGEETLWDSVRGFFASAAASVRSIVD